MASSDALQRLLSGVESRGARWDDPHDLGQLSVDAMVRRAGVEDSGVPQGAIRLHGQMVRSHHVPMSDAAGVMLAWQKLVWALAAAFENVRTVRGRLPQAITDRAQLQLASSPAPGSLVLRFLPGVDETAGQLPLGETRQPLVARAVEDALGLILVADGTDAGEVALRERLNNLGPRVAGGLRILTEAATVSGLDLQFSWRTPGQTTMYSDLDSDSSARIREIIDREKLAAELIRVAGTIRTVSDTSPWLIDTSEGQLYVDAGRLDPSDVHETRVGDFVSLDASLTVTERAGGATRERYEAVPGTLSRHTALED